MVNVHDCFVIVEIMMFWIHSLNLKEQESCTGFIRLEHLFFLICMGKHYDRSEYEMTTKNNNRAMSDNFRAYI